MSDYKLNVRIKLIGDREQEEIVWHVNWWRDKPEVLYKELVEKAKSIGLEVDDKTYLFDDVD